MLLISYILLANINYISFTFTKYMSIFLLTAWLLFWRASISGISGQSSMAVASGFSRVTNSLSFKFLVDDIHWQASTILEGFCNSIWENFFSCLASHLSYRSRSSVCWNLKKNCFVVECSTSSNDLLQNMIYILSNKIYHDLCTCFVFRSFAWFLKPI